MPLVLNHLQFDLDVSFKQDNSLWKQRWLLFTILCRNERKLENYNGDQIASYGNNGSDIISVGTILEAAGVNLNDIQQYPPDAEWIKSSCWNSFIFGIDFNGANGNDVEYTYSVTQVPKVEYKVTLSTYVGADKE